MRFTGLLAAVALLAACDTRSPTPTPTPSPSLSTTPSPSRSSRQGNTRLTQLARDYRALCTAQPSTDLFDKTMERKRATMAALAHSLGAGGRPGSVIRRVMGDPDAVVTPGMPQWDRIGPTDGTTELWIYDWRGRESFVYFELADGVVMGSRWYPAPEPG
jgi:hypothetical protein